MARPDHELTCARARVLLEAYQDGALPVRRAARLQAHLERCAACSDELRQARRVCAALRDLPPQTCSDAVMRRVWERLQAAGAAPEATAAPPPPSLRERLRHALGRAWRPAVATTALAGAAVALLLMVNRQPQVQEISPEDLARAETQVKWVMARLSAIGRATGNTVREDVIEARVVSPATRAVEKVIPDATTTR